MAHSDSVPTRFPEPGFYYHYKHDPKGAVNNYAYLVLGTGHHTEDDCRPIDQNMLNYLPLYENAFVYVNGKMQDNRPLEMFFDVVEKDGVKMPRYARITDEATLIELKKFRDKMYPDLVALLST
jgi:hypothetical protein